MMPGSLVHMQQAGDGSTSGSIHTQQYNFKHVRTQRRMQEKV